MLIGLDLDGVEADWDGYLDSQIALVPELHDFPSLEERGWHEYAKSDPKHKKAIYEILEHPEFYSSLEPIPGAVEAYRKMRKDGHDVVFISSPWATNPMGYQAKADWLYKHFGNSARSNLILAGDKTLVIADVLVDDKPVIKGRLLSPERPGIIPVWQRIFFSQPYNRGLEGPRIENWTDGSWEEVLYGVPVSSVLA